MHSYAEVNFNEPNNVEEIYNQIPWYYSHIKVNGNMICIKQLQEIGIVQIQDLIDDQTGLIYKHDQIYKNFKVKVSYLNYLSFVSVIPVKWKKIIRDYRPNLDHEVVTFFDKILETKKVSATIYKELNDSKAVLNQLKEKWQARLSMEISTELVHYALDVARFTDVVKFSSFQYKLMHNAIFFKDRLYHFGIVSSQTCEWNGIHEDTVTHALLDCSFAKGLCNKLIILK